MTFTMFSGTWSDRTYWKCLTLNLQLPGNTAPPAIRTCRSSPRYSGLQRRFQTGSEARWEGGSTGRARGRCAACTPSRAPVVLLGNVVLCGVRRSGLPDKGLRFPSVLRKLCAARLRSVEDDAAIKACFAPGPMFACEPGRSALPWGGWCAGR